MGLFNKLKNALFEEEEIEIPIKETPLENKPAPVIKEDSVEKKPEIEKKNIDALLDEENERDLFKAENTFKFPEFDEEEFKSSYKPPIEKEEKPAPVVTPKENPTRVKPITYDYDRKPKQSRKENVKKESTEEVNQKKTFRPSPVISPVYGVLDKNYKKEDIITVKEEKPKKVFDVDAIRRKAFGTLEEDIERTFEEPKEEFFGRSEKGIDDLLNDSADEKIDLAYEKRSNTRESRNEKQTRARREETELETVPSERREYRRSADEDESEDRKLYNDIEREMAPTSELQVLEQTSKSEEQRFEEDTLENDLFDLIDSMYDSREEDDESWVFG